MSKIDKVVVNVAVCSFVVVIGHRFLLGKDIHSSFEIAFYASIPYAAFLYYWYSRQEKKSEADDTKD